MRFESIQPPKPLQSEYSASLPNCWPSLSSSFTSRTRKRPGASFEEGSPQRCVSDITPPVQGARAPDSRTAQESSISITSPASNASGARGALRPI